MLNRNDAVLAVVDVQGKLAGLMHGRDALYGNLVKMVRGARALGLPVIWTEQVPDKLGNTVPDIAAALAGLAPVPKSAFSCCGEPAFLDALRATGRTQALVCGIEAHICVYQTARDLVTRGYRAEVVADAVSSRTRENRDLGLRRAERAGAYLTSVETALFELLGHAGADGFRDVARIVK